MTKFEQDGSFSKVILKPVGPYTGDMHKATAYWGLCGNEIEQRTKDFTENTFQGLRLMWLLLFCFMFFYDNFSFHLGLRTAPLYSYHLARFFTTLSVVVLRLELNSHKPNLLENQVLK